MTWVSQKLVFPAVRELLILVPACVLLPYYSAMSFDFLTLMPSLVFGEQVKALNLPSCHPLLLAYPSGRIDLSPFVSVRMSALVPHHLAVLLLNDSCVFCSALLVVALPSSPAVPSGHFPRNPVSYVHLAPPAPLEMRPSFSASHTP